MSDLAAKFNLSIKSHRRVLNEIRVHEEISGANVARNLSLQPSTLVYILRSLKKAGLIRISRIDQQAKSAGKPPTLWKLVDDAGYIIGVEVIQNEMRLCIINFSGKMVFKKAIAIKNNSAAKIAGNIADFINNGLQQAGLAAEQVIGAGIALTGLVERQNGIVRYSRKLNLYDFDLSSALNKLLDFPIEIVNDANAGALGIKWHLEGTGIAAQHVVFLTMNEKNSDMGAGLVLNNQLYEGAFGTAGEIFTILPQLADLIEKLSKDNKADIFTADSPDFLEIIQAAEEQNVAARQILSVYCDIIKVEILRIVEFINPNVIVIGGDISDAKNVIGDKLRTNVKTELEKIFPTGVPAPEILFSDKGIYAVSLGATALVLREIFLMENE